MNKLLIILCLGFTPSALGKPSSKPLKPVIKKFEAVTSHLSVPYIQNYPSSSITIRVRINSLNEGKKIISKQCLTSKVECDIFKDFTNPQLLNISVRGPSINIKKILPWFKTNSKSYQEKKPKQK